MHNNRKVAAIVAAGGKGTRLRPDAPKQFMCLCGKPIIVMSALLMQNHPYVDFAVMVMHSDYLDMWREIKESYALSKFVRAVPGGACRQASVYSGIKAAADEAGAADLIIAIHDGARPLATRDILTEAILAAGAYGGAVAAVPVRDTVKAADAGVITATPDRETLYLAQTPQVFKAELLLRAYESATAEGFTGTDDASLVERIGGTVRLTSGSYRNVKITHPEDIVIAEALGVMNQGESYERKR